MLDEERQQPEDIDESEETSNELAESTESDGAADQEAADAMGKSWAHRTWRSLSTKWVQPRRATRASFADRLRSK